MNAMIFFAQKAKHFFAYFLWHDRLDSPAGFLKRLKDTNGRYLGKATPCLIKNVHG